jgi:hypothetical protein
MHEFRWHPGHEDHGRLRQFLNFGFNATGVHGMRGLIQQSVEELLDRAQD